MLFCKLQIFSVWEIGNSFGIVGLIFETKIRYCRKKIRIDLNFFTDNHIIKKKKWKVIIMLKKFSVENFKDLRIKSHLI